ncbi:MAG: class E sortase [Streptosporangiales bacterium]|nr:class E sortase [Streptosporangiales bacterium]
MRTTLRVVGELLLTSGVLLLFFVAYVLWGTGDRTAEAQDRLGRKFAARPPLPRERAVDRGEPVGTVTIPRLGASSTFVIVEGAGTAELRDGPGHIPGTALPGRRGNFAVAGHRVTYLAPFNRIDELRPGDAIVVTTRVARYTYRMTGHRVVTPDHTELIAPVPGHAGARPKDRYITLISCHPKFSAAQRYVVLGRLDRVSARPDREGR